jgi:hypothetical protein
MLTIRDWSSGTSLGRAGTGTFRYKVRISNALVTKLTQPKINIAKMSLDISSSSSRGNGELRSAHEGTAGYKLRTRSRETRIKMAKMARAMCEEDDDELSESKTRITIKRPRSYVRASVITRRERASSSSDDVERSAHEDRTGYMLSRRSRETRNNMPTTSRAIYEEDHDDESRENGECMQMPSRYP